MFVWKFKCQGFSETVSQFIPNYHCRKPYPAHYITLWIIHCSSKSDILCNLIISTQSLCINSRYRHRHADSNALAPIGPEAFKIKPWFFKPQLLMVTNVWKQSNRKGKKTKWMVCNGSDGSNSGRLQSLLRPRSSYRLRN